MGEVEWAEIRAGGSSQDVPAVRASRKLVSEELFLTNLGAVRLKMELDRALWRNADHINTRQLWECLCSYLYLLGSTEEFAELYRKNFPRVISVFEASIH